MITSFVLVFGRRKGGFLPNARENHFLVLVLVHRKDWPYREENAFTSTRYWYQVPGVTVPYGYGYKVQILEGIGQEYLGVRSMVGDTLNKTVHWLRTGSVILY